MKNLICTLILFLSASSYLLAQESTQKIEGFIYDAQTEKALANVNIFIKNSQTGSSSDRQGLFNMVLQAKSVLVVRHIGYKEVEVEIVAGKNRYNIALQPMVIKQKESIIIHAAAERHALDKNKDKWLNSTEDILKRFDGVTLMRRANFALEPSIRGLSYGQISTTIDGMKIFHACVDRMDPVTGYVEVENLETIEVAQGAYDLSNASVGGSINMVTQKPHSTDTFFQETEIGYESASALRRIRSALNFTLGSTSIRGSFSVKKADDFYAGDNKKILNSGYKKHNYALGIKHFFNENHNLYLNYIGDFASDIGYPALLMDATDTKTHIFSSHYTWNQVSQTWRNFNVKLYFNSVKHWMDDYSRDVTKRSVMKDMYMPMYGFSKTTGAQLGITYVPSNTQYLNLKLEWYQLHAFADMLMESIFPNVSDMYLYNIGDMKEQNFAFIADYNMQLAHNWLMRINSRTDVTYRDLYNTDGKNQLLASTAAKSTKVNKAITSGSLSFAYKSEKRGTFTLKTAFANRLPSHIENYSFFTYNLLDDFFYNGSPDLKPEKSVQSDISWQFSRKQLHIKTTLFYNHLTDYIAGKKVDKETKIYTNYSAAYLSGLELNAAYNIDSNLTLKTTVNYTYGYNNSLSEPLPYVAPLSIHSALQYQYNNLWLELTLLHNTAQKQIAHKSTVEDKTAQFTTAHMRARYKIGMGFELKAGVENMFDRNYHEHLSINNLPSLGRNLYFGLNYMFRH